MEPALDLDIAAAALDLPDGELEQSILTVLATAGVKADDVPGLSGLLVAAARAASSRGPSAGCPYWCPVLREVHRDL